MILNFEITISGRRGPVNRFCGAKKARGGAGWRAFTSRRILFWNRLPWRGNSIFDALL